MYKCIRTINMYALENAEVNSECNLDYKKIDKQNICTLWDVCLKLSLQTTSI